jgi:hypothetical protein
MRIRAKLAVWSVAYLRWLAGENPARIARVRPLGDGQVGGLGDHSPGVVIAGQLGSY